MLAKLTAEAGADAAPLPVSPQTPARAAAMVTRFSSCFELTTFSLSRAADLVAQHVERLHAHAQQALAEHLDTGALRVRLGDLFLQLRALITCASPILIDLAAAAQAGDFELRMSADAFDLAETTAFAVPSLSLRTALARPTTCHPARRAEPEAAARLRKPGLDENPCHLGQLDVHDGRVWLGDRPVDIIDRLFMIEDLLESPEAPALMDPVLDAAARGEVKIYTPMDSGIFASKGALAMLSDEANRPLFDPEELASLDRILPWTRMVRPGPVTLEDGCRVDLLDYALTHQHDLALKPTLLHGGQGVLLGWRADTSAAAWEEQVRAALDEPYVIQRRIRPVPELFPADGRDPVPWIVCWGRLHDGQRPAGFFARASSVESNVEVINLGTGAHAGSCLHARSGGLN